MSYVLLCLLLLAVAWTPSSATVIFDICPGVGVADEGKNSITVGVLLDIPSITGNNVTLGLDAYLNSSVDG